MLEKKEDHLKYVSLDILGLLMPPQIRRHTHPHFLPLSVNKNQKTVRKLKMSFEKQRPTHPLTNVQLPLPSDRRNCTSRNSTVWPVVE
jgi:hypothetical protein